MVSVFLSHSSQDKPFVRDLADALEAGAEIKVWLDEREIGYGENIAVKIGEGLDADVVLLILSPDSVASSRWPSIRTAHHSSYRSLVSRLSQAARIAVVHRRPVLRALPGCHRQGRG